MKDNEDIGESVFAKFLFLCQLYSLDCHGGEKLVCSIVLLRFITELNAWINKTGLKLTPTYKINQNNKNCNPTHFLFCLYSNVIL